MVIIKGIQKTSMIDYPGRVCAVLFTAGCNMRCPFCQNPDLILHKEKLPDLSTKKILGFLGKRKKWLDGVCITGGEPLIHPDIIDLIKEIKKTGLLVKIDTNGLNPSLLKKIIDSNLVDYIAMDIKSDKEHYAEAAGVKADLIKIEKSIKLIKDSSVEYEFRSTVVPDFFDEQIVENIGRWLEGSKRFALQQFRSSLPLLDKSFENKTPYSEEVFIKFRNILSKYIREVEVRI